jgi:lipopolysaccharide export system protein LptA
MDQALRRLFYGLICILAIFATAVHAQGEKKVKKRAEGQTVITANKLDYNYRSNIAVFKGNVVVKDPEIRMTADEMSITLDRTNSVVKQVVASGSVHVTFEDKIATGRNAVYNALKGEIELRGDAQIMRGEDIVKGDRIIFWMKEGKMVVEPGTVMMSPKTRADGSMDSVFKMDGSTDKKNGAKEGE